MYSWIAIIVLAALQVATLHRMWRTKQELSEVSRCETIDHRQYVEDRAAEAREMRRIQARLSVLERWQLSTQQKKQSSNRLKRFFGIK